MNNPRWSDGYLVRYLVSRQFDLSATIKKWDAFIDWRNKNDIDNIGEFEFKEIDNVRKYYPHGYFMTDKVGRPVYIEKIGSIVVNELF